jgi:diguanylate cyclase (GGDEF)-like protein/PAS domain S-box-containing protein|tara:strand:- start:371 stop:1288 length:918 start_codon:yes stop_codon:yes gene_type:complete
VAKYNDTQLPIHTAELKLALDNLPAYVYIKDDYSRYVYANKLTLNLLACNESELLFKTDMDLFPQSTAEKLLNIDARVLSGERTREEIELTLSKGEKSIFWEVKSPIFSDSDPNKVIGILGISTDITERKELEQQLLYDASTDPLTDLLNRRYFFLRLALALQLSKSKQTYGAVIFIDLNKFKKLNDMYGHNVGDDYLIEISKRMKTTMRDNDCIARLGGDEFVILLEGLGREEQHAKDNARRVAHKIQSAIEVEFRHPHVTYYGSASVGVTMFYGNTKSAEEVVAQADQSMYLIKHSLNKRIDC